MKPYIKNRYDRKLDMVPYSTPRALVDHRLKTERQVRKRNQLQKAFSKRVMQSKSLKVDFEVKISIFEKVDRMSSRHVGSSEIMFWVPESGQKPFWTIQDTSEAILTKKIFPIFFHFFCPFLKGFWPIFEGLRRKILQKIDFFKNEASYQKSL